MELGANTNQKANLEYTPLHLAAQLNQIEIAQMLINFGADADAQDVSNRTPLHIANDYNHAAVLLILLKCGASQHIKNDEGDKVLESSLKTKNHNIFKTILYHQ